MNEEKRKILDMLAQGKITVDEAEKLLAAVGEPAPKSRARRRAENAWKYLRVQVEPGPGSENGDRVNIRVPFKLIRAGLKFAAFIPRRRPGQGQRGLQGKRAWTSTWPRSRPQDLEDLVSNLDDMTVEVDGKDKVRIFCE